MSTPLTNQAREMLESMIDHWSLAEVVEALAHIAAEKGEHVRTTWQDDELAASWDNAGEALGQLENTFTIEGI